MPQSSSVKPNVETHTPGPWKWFDYPDGRKLLSAPSRAVIHCPDAPMTCNAADASLIAAAPELIAAVRDLLDRFVEFDHASWSEAEIAARDRALAAIAKAEGR